MLEKFKEELLRRGKSQNTIDTYSRNIYLFIKWLEETIGEAFDYNITAIDARMYKGYLLNTKKLSINSINAKLTAIQVYADFLHYTSQMSAIKIEKQKGTVSLSVSVLEKNELYKCRRYVHSTGNLLNIAIFELFLNTGIRVSELSELTLDDIIISDKKGVVIIRNGKGGKYREVPLNNDARKALKEYLQIRPLWDNTIVFIGQRGPIGRNGIYKIIQKIGQNALNKNELHPHMLRHQCFTLMNKNGVDIKTIAELAGHSTIELTAKYYISSSQKDKENAVKSLEF